QLEDEVAREIDALCASGVTHTEVDRAIALMQSDYIEALQSAGDRADRLSMFATYFENPALINSQVERYRSVTASRVNTFIAERLRENNRASLLYIPRDPVASDPGHAKVAAGS